MVVLENLVSQSSVNWSRALSISVRIWPWEQRRLQKVKWHVLSCVFIRRVHAGAAESTSLWCGGDSSCWSPEFLLADFKEKKKEVSRVWLWSCWMWLCFSCTINYHQSASELCLKVTRTAVFMTASWLRDSWSHSCVLKLSHVLLSWSVTFLVVSSYCLGTSIVREVPWSRSGLEEENQKGSKVGIN